jgi:hypothetical protein
VTGPPADSAHALDPEYQHTVRADALFGDFTYEGLLNFYQSENVVVNRDANRTDRLLVIGTIENGQTMVDEILTMVSIALAKNPISDCLAGDANDDGQIISMRSSGRSTMR